MLLYVLAFLHTLVYFRLHRVHEMQTIVTNMRSVCPYVCQSVCDVGSCNAVFAKSLWFSCLNILFNIVTVSSFTECVNFVNLFCKL